MPRGSVCRGQLIWDAWSHACRRFVEAHKTHGRNGGLPDQALQFFQRLY